MIGLAGIFTRTPTLPIGRRNNERSRMHLLASVHTPYVILLSLAMCPLTSAAQAQPSSEGSLPDYLSISQTVSGDRTAPRLSIESERGNHHLVTENDVLFPESFLSVLHSKYTAWEMRLEGSGVRTNVNGRLVYPLMQINYAKFRLPITLYIPPLRGSDAAR